MASPDVPLQTCLHLLYKQKERKGPQVNVLHSIFLHSINTPQVLVKLFDRCCILMYMEMFLTNIYKTVVFKMDGVHFL